MQTASILSVVFGALLVLGDAAEPHLPALLTPGLAALGVLGLIWLQRHTAEL